MIYFNPERITRTIKPLRRFMLINIYTVHLFSIEKYTRQLSQIFNIIIKVLSCQDQYLRRHLFFTSVPKHDKNKIRARVSNVKS